ncbi:hypothetical protein DPMN_183186 [Dreissena polymorpha]|uniref:Uncharacterized protein n=1 Tax=Dreissena polymorpha TaxID=45954 RepID=A0A9D4I3E0_DREPO|nr:hypothetical protein DPMN_183186 [Dreissena polymorpha]
MVPYLPTRGCKGAVSGPTGEPPIVVALELAVWSHRLLADVPDSLSNDQILVSANLLRICFYCKSKVIYACLKANINYVKLQLYKNVGCFS